MHVLRAVRNLLQVTTQTLSGRNINRITKNMANLRILSKTMTWVLQKAALFDWCHATQVFEWHGNISDNNPLLLSQYKYQQKTIVFFQQKQGLAASIESKLWLSESKCKQIMQRVRRELSLKKLDPSFMRGQTSDQQTDQQQVNTIVFQKHL